MKIIYRAKLLLGILILVAGQCAHAQIGSIITLAACTKWCQTGFDTCYWGLLEGNPSCWPGPDGEIPQWCKNWAYESCMTIHWYGCLDYCQDRPWVTKIKKPWESN